MVFDEIDERRRVQAAGACAARLLLPRVALTLKEITVAADTNSCGAP